MNSVNPECKISTQVVNRVVNLACQGNVAAAERLLKPFGLNELQMLAANHIFQLCKSDPLDAPNLKERFITAITSDAPLVNQPICTSEISPLEMQTLQERCHLIMNELILDVSFTIFAKCFQDDDLDGLLALSCVNKFYNKQITLFTEKQIDLQKLCPELATLNAAIIKETVGIEITDEPLINPLAILKWYRAMAPHVEGNAGVTLLTLWKGLNLNQIIAIAAKEGMEVNDRDGILKELGNDAIEQTCIIMIANNVFKDSRNKKYAAQKDHVQNKVGCEMSTMLESVALCVLTRIKSQSAIILFGRNPLTYGRTSTHVDGDQLVVGGSAPARLSVYNNSNFAYVYFGAGGRRKF